MGARAAGEAGLRCSARWSGSEPDAERSLESVARASRAWGFGPGRGGCEATPAAQTVIDGFIGGRERTGGKIEKRIRYTVKLYPDIPLYPGYVSEDRGQTQSYK